MPQPELSVVSPVLAELGDLLARRNALDEAIARLTGRPATTGHLGEFIAARVFNLELEASASARGIDGRFTDGPLAGRTVNVKWFSVQQGGLDLVAETGPDFYLVLTGPREAVGSSRGAKRPLVIEAAYLFEAAPLLADLRARGVQIGVFSSVRSALWEEAMIYPEARHPLLSLAPAQHTLLTLFSPHNHKRAEAPTHKISRA